MPGEQLPEGTDAIVTGAGVDAQDDRDADTINDAAAALTTAAAPAAAPASAETKTGGDEASKAGEPAPALSERIEGLKGEAGDRARSFVESAKTRATDGIDDVVRMINDAATEVDGVVGTNIGDYIRRAGESVASLSESLKGKEVDDLFADARGLIQKAPGVAVGVAAALGFVVARLAQSGIAAATADQPEPRNAA